jgi:hypothetical protein
MWSDSAAMKILTTKGAKCAKEESRNPDYGLLTGRFDKIIDDKIISAGLKHTARY